MKTHNGKKKGDTEVGIQWTGGAHDENTSVAILELQILNHAEGRAPVWLLYELDAHQSHG